MSRIAITLIEDNDEIREHLTNALERIRYDVTAVSRGGEGLSAVATTSPDLVILDLGLPDINGMDVLKMLRSSSQTPIVVATALDDEGQIVRALDLGADDYVVKPFSAAQMDARIRAVLRRGDTGPTETYQVGDLFVDIQSHIVTHRGVELPLRPKEFALLAHLVKNAGRIVSKSELITHVWNGEFGTTEKTVDVHLSWLRRRLGETAAAPRFIQSVRSVGVKLVDPAS